MVMPATDAAAATAAAAVTCSTEYNLYSANVGWGRASTSSPYTLYERTSGTDTSYCRSGSNPDYHFQQYGTSRCLLLSADNSTIKEGSCSGASYAKWHQIDVATVDGLEEVEMQSEYNKACIWERGVGDTLTFKACNSKNGEDEFLFP
jgi:hypothetical protein